MLPSLQHYASTMSEVPSLSYRDQVTAIIVPKKAYDYQEETTLTRQRNRYENNGFEIYSPVLAPSSIYTETAILARATLSPIYAQDIAQTRYLNTSAPLQTTRDLRSVKFDVTA
jgi:hypothetical protein